MCHCWLLPLPFWPSNIVFSTFLCACLLCSLAKLASTTTASGAEDLISARCQSKCLFELEQRHKNNSEAKRLLRHQISTLCKEDVQCASCIVPCRELVLDNELCAQTLCRDTTEPTQCRQSCAFLERIAAHKPGQCPKQKVQSALDSECSAFCDADNDCSEIEKCCVIGCSRTCMEPMLNDSRILPRPEGISVQERKRKRSAILRWIMKRLTPQHTATNSNLFVIQWRWSIHKQPETMTPWQTVMVRNKMYAILKHLLAPGRYYLFRVAAVNVHGTYGFSQPSHPPFKLSKEVKAPAAPSNLTALPFVDSYEQGKGVAKLSWSPPDSELPIKEYRLSWWQTSPELANAFEFRQRRSSKGSSVDEDYDGGAGEMAGEIDGEVRKSSQVLPSYSTKAELVGLERGKVYMVELYATVESSEGELRGEPAILFVKAEDQMASSKMKMAAMSTTTTTNVDFADDVGAGGNELGVAELKTPFFEGGRLKTIVSWLDHPNCDAQRLRREQTPQFRVLIRSVRCLNQLPPQQFLVHNCVATLENLQFRCEYFVRVEKTTPVAGGGKAANKSGLIARLTFATLPCEQTPTDVPLQCEDGLREQHLLIPAAQAQPLEAPSTPASSTKATTTVAAPVKKTTKTSSTRTTTTKSAAARKTKNGGGRKLDRRDDTEEEVEWLPIEEVEREEEESDKPKERGTRTRSSSSSSSVAAASASSKPKDSAQQRQQQLSCFATSGTTAECSWSWPAHLEQKNNRLIGFRTVLSSTLLGASTNVTIVDPEQRRLHLTGLSAKSVYRFRLQAVTAHGLGAELVEHFSTGHLAATSGGSSRGQQSTDLAIHIGAGGDQFPGIVELPWGSSSSASSSRSRQAAAEHCFSSYCYCFLYSFRAFPFLLSLFSALFLLPVLSASLFLVC